MEQENDKDYCKRIALHAAREGARVGIEAYQLRVKALCSDFRASLATIVKQQKTKILLARTTQESQAIQQLSQLHTRDANISKKLEVAMLNMGKLALDAANAVIENELLVKEEDKN